VTDQAEEGDAQDASPRQRPLLAVDFGHAVWLKHVRAADDEGDEEPYERGQKRLRLVSFPGVRLEGEGHAVRSGIGGGGGPDGSFEMEEHGDREGRLPWRQHEGSPLVLPCLGTGDDMVWRSKNESFDWREGQVRGSRGYRAKNMTGLRYSRCGSRPASNDHNSKLTRGNGHHVCSFFSCLTLSRC
jgi:hypothetical protein